MSDHLTPALDSSWLHRDTPPSVCSECGCQSARPESPSSSLARAEPPTDISDDEIPVGEFFEPTPYRDLVDRVKEADLRLRATR